MIINKKTIITVFLVIVFLNLYGQNLQDLLNNWSEKNPIEKVYLHIDRENYHSGENIWFKAYFTADFLPSYLSSSIYVELIDENENIKKKEVFPVFFGTIQGQIGIDTALISGNYILRAYSPLMLNQSDFLFKRRIRIVGWKMQAPSNHKTGQLQLNFFPEGGNLIEGMTNMVAFKANNEEGLPVDLSLTIKNQNEEIIEQTKSLHDGMGAFSILPKKGEQYYAIIGKKRYSFPQAVSKGISIQLIPSIGKIRFLMEQQEKATAFKPSYMLGQMQNRVVFRMDFKADKIKHSGIIQTASLPSGILHVTIFNSDNIPLAERLVFVNNKEYILPAQIHIDTLNTEKRLYNKFNLQLKDTVSGNFSISVTDADFENSEPREQNIYSWFLLNSDLKGYIHNPSWYFNNIGDSVYKALDLVMMTNGWRRFKWIDVVNNTLPQPMFKDNGFIKLSGRATLEGSKKPFAEKELLIMISPKDTTFTRRKYTKILQTDSQGNFAIDSLVFYGQSNLLFSDVRGGSGRFLKVKLSEDSLQSKYYLPEQKIYPYFDKESLLATDNNLAKEYEQYLKRMGKVLETVTVTGKMKTRIQELDEKYTTGLFARGIMARSLDLTKDDISGGMNIFEYLQSRIPGLDVVKIDYYHLFYRKPVAARVYNTQFGEQVPKSIMGGQPNEVNIFLDEMPVTADVIASLPISNLAYLKIFPTFLGNAGGGGDGAIAIYTKQGLEAENPVASSFEIISYRGYSITKEFYNPDYSIPKMETEIEDNRLTLLWQPNIYVNDANASIPIRFYNNDRTKAFKIVVEGITNNGKLLMFEKIIK